MTTIKTYPHSLAAAILALAGFAANASATPVVNINLGNASNANVLNGTAYLTGGFAQAPASYTGTAWNDYSVSPVTLATALLDSDGNVTTVGLDTNSTTTVGNNLQGPATSAGGADVKLLKGYVNRVYNSSSGSNLNHRLTISGLDIAKTYNIYLASAHNTPVKCSWRIGATGTDKFITNTPATRTAQTWVAGDDYVAFYKVAPDAGGNILVYGQGLANNDGGAYSGLTLNGIQVMDATGFLSPENDMLTCAFGALGSAWITGSTTNLTLYAPTGTDVTALEPTFTLSPGATIAPTGPQDFTSPVAYTVYAEDGTPKVYTISVVVGPVPVFVSNALTPWEPASPGAGVRIDILVPSGESALLVGRTQTHWGSGGFSRSVLLNGNTFILDSGGGNGANYAGPISGDGAVIIQNNGQTIGGSLGNTYTGTTNVNTVVTLNKSSGNALCGTTTGTGAVITWAANDQINDASSVTLVSGSSLALAGHTETIASLTLATGTSVNTGTDGVLTVGALTVDGTVMPSGTYTSADGFVTGTGSVVVSAAGTPYEIWAAANAGGQTPGEDYDSDGVQNGVAFFMGMNGLATNPGVVNGKVTWPNGGNIPSPAYGTQFVVQTSTDLVNWADVLVGDLNLNNTSGSVAYTLPTGDAKQFCRLSVTP